MKLYVHPHKIEIDKDPINEKEIDITKCEFVFDDEITDQYVKDVYFTFEGETYQVPNIQNDQCDIPYEVLERKGQVEIGVVAYLVEDETEIKRYNPSPAYFNTWVGSLKDQYENTQPITPSDKEQIEQQLLNISTQMNNLDVDAEKVDHTTTVVITKKDGSQKQVQILDGEQGPQGEPGVPGAVKFLIVNELPTEDIQTDAMYLVPKNDPSTSDLYDEYMYVDNDWELIGEKQIVVDLTNYVQFTDYASSSKGGVIKTSTNYGFDMFSNGFIYAPTKTYAQYQALTNELNIGKGTLENVITGKGLVSNTDYATTSTGGVIIASSYYGNGIVNGYLCGVGKTYADYTNGSNALIVCKQTLDNVLTARIGDIQTLLDTLNTGNGVS